jgi:hypothetical protein
MAFHAFRFAVAAIALLLASMFTSSLAYAQASDGRDKPNAVTASGASPSNAIDLLSDPTWQAHESTWDGVRFVQIYNTTSGARVAALQIDATGWVIQTDAQSPVTGRTVYRDSTVEVIQYRQSNQDRWIVRPAEATR